MTKNTRHKLYKVLSVLTLSLAVNACSSTSSKNVNQNTENQNTINQDTNNATPVDIQMVVLGDSISTGVFADSSVEGEVSGTFLDSLHGLVPDIGSVLSLFTSSDQGFSVQTLQDNFSRPDLIAWTGDSSWSHETRLRANGHDVEALNLAVVGDRIQDAGAQLDRLDQTYSQGSFEKANYFVLQFGANDFCGGTNTDSFRQSLTTTLDRIKDTHPDAVTLVLGVPAIDKVFAITSGGTNPATISRESVIAKWSVPSILATDIGVDCSMLRQSFEFCPIIEQTNQSSAQATIDEMNQIVAEVIDSRSEVVHFEGFSDPDFISKENLGVDCFHPNQNAQKIMADESWDLIQNAIANLK